MAQTKSKNWKQHFDFIYKHFISVASKKNVKPTNAGFCTLLSISSGKLQNWVKGQWPSAEDLAQLHNIFGFAYSWLVTGEGDPWNGDSKGDCASTEEAQIFSDRLSVVLDYRNLTTEFILRETGFPPKVLEDLTSGTRLPTFSEMEILYTALGIEPAYFFHGDETQMYVPQTQLEQVMFSIGAFSQYVPSHFALQRWFGIGKDEAKKYLASYKAGRKNLEEYGQSECDERELITEMALPPTWLEYFSEHARLSLPWLCRNSRVPALWQEHAPTGADISKLLELYEENRQLRLHIEQLEKTEEDPALSDMEQQEGVALGAPLGGRV